MLSLLCSRCSVVEPSVTDYRHLVPAVHRQQNYNIRVTREGLYGIGVRCQLPSGDILLADYECYRLEKCDARGRVIGKCNFPDTPYDVCYVGNNKAVVSFYRKLQFVDVTGMTLTRSVSTKHYCRGLTCHGNQLYVTDFNTVYMYSTDGIKQRVLYTPKLHNREFTFMRSIAMSDDGRKLYVLRRSTLITLDSSGNLLSTFYDRGLHDALKLHVDGENHVLVCGGPGGVLQISSNGKRKLRTITYMSEDTRHA